MCVGGPFRYHGYSPFSGHFGGGIGGFPGLFPSYPPFGSGYPSPFGMMYGFGGYGVPFGGLRGGSAFYPPG
ncbi:hypothetical protein DPMN_010363 [Dreissena polymorpha]|uniref:Uncharacterized protein n=1 Tax=Dreissena polymorpha TaxID=45954 RepID=A0A9D4N1Y7_DREPO|nr:hypothetical protein DPMN_010363 [Dreissena polymorpha]